ncbi:MAG: ABC transporter ATP-binding protein [Candidatus Omnitrophica bacterium]|nr:ABC transporter ATP-binding protein [Candidatus Omnitrophota bacterium]
MIEIKNLIHEYKGQRALDGLNLSITPNDVFGFLGPNGCGKTTLFRILSTLFPPTNGEVQMMGRDLLTDFYSIRRKLGVVFQNSSLDVKLTVWENMIYQGRLYGLSGRVLVRRVEELLNRFGLSERKKDLAGVLSGGLKRRVELAKSLLHDPSILILDEPSTGLDPGARLDLWKYIQYLKSMGNVTVLVTTHLMEEAENCARVAVMNKGCLAALGSPDELKKELPGEVVEIQTAKCDELRQAIEKQYDLQAQIIPGGLKLEHPEGHRMVAQLMEKFTGLVDAVMVRKPTLEDVFIHKTGYQFWMSDQSDETPDRIKQK